MASRQDVPGAVIFGLSGPDLTTEEADFFQEVDPAGFILFARNCDNPKQLRDLTDSLRASVRRDCPILIDQEGGRVARLRPPHWPSVPPMRTFGDRARTDPHGAERDLRACLGSVAEALAGAGITVNCAPVLDLATPATHDVIGDRAFSDDAAVVARLGQVACEAFLAAGIVPVIKHIPGHGRAACDSHLALPRVETCAEILSQSDFKPFAALANGPLAGRIWAMTAHILYTEIDGARCASASAGLIENIIRKKIGFSGMLLSDDLGMEALATEGPVGRRAAAVLEAGCDLALHCSGKMEEMREIAEYVGPMRPESLARLAPRFETARKVA